jgi:hypothetical protein
MSSARHPKSDRFLVVSGYIQKTWVLNFCPFVFAAFHSLAEKQTE